MINDEAKRFVKVHYPFAEAVRCQDWRIVDKADPDNWKPLSIYRDNEADAWINAANRILKKERTR